MLTIKDQLIELVRLLENKGHVFTADPLLITEKLADPQTVQAQSQQQVQPRATATDYHHKLHLRAKGIDSTGELAHTLHKINGRIKLIIFLVSIFWCINGFLGLFALMQTQTVNFFFVLVCILGVHSIMLVLWLLMSFKKTSHFGLFFNPSFLIRGKDTVTQTAVHLYSQQIRGKAMRWYLGKISHQLWLATLAGMLLAIIFLLIVRQYTFTWQSTLLSPATLVLLVEWLAWLPAKLGFSVPTAQAVAQSQLTGDFTLSTQWAGLLIGSLLCYGFMPRAIAWAVCTLMFKQQKQQLDLNLPYYQKIIAQWQQQIIDPDDFVEAPKPIAPKAQVSNANKLVCLLEYAHDDVNWYRKVLVDEQVEDFGVLDDRDDMDRLLAYLQDSPVQVLLGISEHALPDRGTLRKLDKIAQLAKGGIIVQLLSSSVPLDDAQKQQRDAQWQQALAERQIGLVSE